MCLDPQWLNLILLSLRRIRDYELYSQLPSSRFEGSPLYYLSLSYISIILRSFLTLYFMFCLTLLSFTTHNDLSPNVFSSWSPVSTFISKFSLFCLRMYGTIPLYITLRFLREINIGQLNRKRLMNSYSLCTP